ncbi:hypothetical protein HH310_02040 [Actinoplanes sp. TBRC 11911]|uniref:hypothetical protein n=1 Tax=Actinoplanes sp. TBRC 11911 TaxID=2729386 RepID=UPI00145E8798|nr:hypothetical protein [Actinoplanes sp. TBRC 11911]NMO49976.1 hypothetical protein [Actinoplanes sp. TBRC 11911]
MSLSPGYGETPIAGEESDSLTPRIRAALGETITKAAVYDLEQAVQADVAIELVNLDKGRYISLLREYDQHRDARELASFIAVKPFGN